MNHRIYDLLRLEFFTQHNPLWTMQAVACISAFDPLIVEQHPMVWMCLSPSDHSLLRKLLGVSSLGPTQAKLLWNVCIQVFEIFLKNKSPFRAETGEVNKLSSALSYFPNPDIVSLSPMLFP